MKRLGTGGTHHANIAAIYTILSMSRVGVLKVGYVRSVTV